MKKLSLFALAAAGLFLGACSNDDAVKEVVNPGTDFKDGAFIGISLSLPTADNSTRANDDLSNGTEEEFAVKNATLYIFKLAASSTANPDEAATYVDKVSLGNTYDKDTQGGINPDEWKVQDGVDATNITSTYNKATLIPNELASQMKADTENNYYAYVIINHNGQVGVEADMTFKDFCDQPFTEIGADIAAEQNVWETGLLMTNSPICDKAGGKTAPADGAKYSTLVKLDQTCIFGSRAEAEESPAACVYVERAAVKITVVDNRTEKKIGDYDVTLVGWQVINNEPRYYNTRHINNDGAAAEAWGPYTSDHSTLTGKNNKYRFVSLNQFLPTLPTDDPDDHTVGFRTYFATDLQYNKNATLANTVASDERPWIAFGKHAYTTENTFDVAHQTWQNTTMVTLKYTVGTEGFYTVGKGSQIMYLDDADMTVAGAKSAEDKAAAAIENILKGDNDVAQALTNLRTKISENNVNKTVTSGLTVTITKPTVVVDDTTDPVTTEEVGKTGVAFTVEPAYTITDNSTTPATVTAVTSYTTEEQALVTALENAIKAVMYSNPTEADPDKLEYNEAVLLSYYKGGESYHNVKIQHFGDYETPWAATSWSTANPHIAGGGDGVNEIYFGVAKSATPSTAQIALAQNRFLGRYGVVRDNWYKLSVDKIGKIGTAEPVDPSTVTPDTPDDEIENYISVHVHIIPWVLREQKVEF